MLRWIEPRARPELRLVLLGEPMHRDHRKRLVEGVLHRAAQRERAVERDCELLGSVLLDGSMHADREVDYTYCRSRERLRVAGAEEDEPHIVAGCAEERGHRFWCHLHRRGSFLPLEHEPALFVTVRMKVENMR